MIRQYRIDRYNGLEFFVCECFRKHTVSQTEYNAYQSWKDAQPDASEEDKSFSVFRIVLDEQLHREDVKNYFGLDAPIPVYDNFPAIILRGVVADNRIASLQVDYAQSVLVPEVVSEINRFYGVLDSRHWRNMVSHQVERYGSLFGSADD